jgi:putative endonuclease
VTRLVWCEPHDTRELAFQRERRMKDWKRQWKIKLIEATNPNWDDLYDTMNGAPLNSERQN